LSNLINLDDDFMKQISSRIMTLTENDKYNKIRLDTEEFIKKNNLNEFNEIQQLSDSKGQLLDSLNFLTTGSKWAFYGEESGVTLIIQELNGALMVGNIIVYSPINQSETSINGTFNEFGELRFSGQSKKGERFSALLKTKKEERKIYYSEYYESKQWKWENVPLMPKN
ncbi:MAG: hypothetical protein GX425_15980, partial [Peptococcaceae bacterium]|nr:hypothetical protein [Peptococcaceae bacterium]